VTTTAGSPTSPAVRPRSPLYGAVIGLASLAVLLQGVWAGLFLREGTYDDSWVTVHSVGGSIAALLALIGTVIAFIQLRARRDVLIGSVVFTLLLVLEIFLGATISDSHSVGAQAVHIPLALFLMGMAVWLPLRARGSARTTS
jgi:uncharacterized membrane protein